MMPFECESVLWDLDDTLTETIPEYRYLVLGNTAKNLGLPINNKQIDILWSASGRNQHVENWFGIEPGIFWKEFTRQDNPEMRKKYIVAYVDSRYLHEIVDDYSLGLVTGSPGEIIESKLEAIGGNIFDSVRSTFDPSGELEKPNPHYLIECIEEMGSKPEKSIYVGNDSVDILTAHNAGVFSVLINRRGDSYHGPEPCARIKSLYELETILK